MPTIGDLSGFGRAFCGRLSIGRRPVPTDDFNSRMVNEPILHSIRIAIRQEIDDIASLQIYDDGAVTSSFAPRPVVDADTSRRRKRLRIPLLNASKQRIRAGGDGQPHGEARTGFAAE